MKTTLTLAFALVSLFCLAQSPSFSVHAGPAYTVSSAENTNIEFRQFFFLNDSLGFSLPALQDVSFRVEDKIGANLGAKVHFKLGKRLGIATGLNFAWSRLNVLAEFGNITPIPGDTSFVNLNPNPITNPFTPFNPCTQFEPSPIPFNELDRSIDYNMLHLQIPLDLTFQISSAFQVSAGMLLSTPLHTDIGRNVFFSERIEERDPDGNIINVICRDNVERLHDDSGNGFNNMMLHVNLGVAYQITPQLAIEAMVSRNANQLFSLPEGSAPFSPSTRVDQITILRTALNVRYTFGVKDMEVTPN